MTTTREPFREGLLTLDPLQLIGGRCDDCGEHTFPRRSVCPSCRSDAGLAPVGLSAEGVVHTFTIVRQAPPGVAVPYALAYVDLLEGVRVLTQIAIDVPDDVMIGMGVRLVERAMGASEAGVELIGYQFTPTEEQGAHA